MPFQFVVGRSLVGLVRLLGKPDRITRLGKAVRDDVLPRGLALVAPASVGKGALTVFAPALAYPLVAPGAYAEPEAKSYAQAECQPAAPAHSRLTTIPVSTAASTPSKAAEAEAAPSHPAHASPSRTPTGAAEREEIEDASAREEEG